MLIAALAFNAMTSCFIDVDINTDVHDNPVQIGPDVCQIIEQVYNDKAEDGGVGAVLCDVDSGVCDPAPGGAPCEDKSECQSDMCLCELCVDPEDLLDI